MNNTQKTVKRWFDIAVSVVCLVVFSPLFLYCYILIRNEDGGPAIFSQERIGMHGKPFFIYKIRSMKVDAVSGATLSSKAVIETIGRSLDALSRHEEALSHPSFADTFNLISILALLTTLGMAVLPLFVKNKRYRTI